MTKQRTSLPFRTPNAEPQALSIVKVNEIIKPSFLLKIPKAWTRILEMYLPSTFCKQSTLSQIEWTAIWNNIFNIKCPRKTLQSTQIPSLYNNKNYNEYSALNYITKKLPECPGVTSSFTHQIRALFSLKSFRMQPIQHCWCYKRMSHIL